jgi:hypothetical protein
MQPNGLFLELWSKEMMADVERNCTTHAPLDSAAPARLHRGFGRDVLRWGAVWFQRQRDGLIQRHRSAFPP